MMRKVKPRPWKWEYREDTKHEATALRAADHSCVLDANADVHGEIDQELFIEGYPEDFAFIETACNTRDDLLAACEAAEKALAALIETLYGQGLEVANWHKNGDLEAMDNFFDENTTGDELPKLRAAIARAQPEAK